MQKLIFTLLAFGGAEATLGQRLRGAAPADDAHRGQDGEAPRAAAGGRVLASGALEVVDGAVHGAKKNR